MQLKDALSSQRFLIRNLLANKIQSKTQKTQTNGLNFTTRLAEREILTREIWIRMRLIYCRILISIHSNQIHIRELEERLREELLLK